MRLDNRLNDELRKVKISRNYLLHPEGSVLIEVGNTKVICTAIIEERVPPFLKGTGKGWVSAEYSMLPGSTGIRKSRDINRGKLDGRSQEIQRLIGRSLRTAVDLEGFGERTLWIDCDVIQADGGTRTASITGAFVAMVDAFSKLKGDKIIDEIPVKSFVSAISVGILNGEAILDLCYEEDSKAEVDMNIVMTDKGQFVEIQGTGEESTFTQDELLQMIQLATKGCRELYDVQKNALKRKIILSSGNKHKVSEIKDILRDMPFEVVSKDSIGYCDFDVEEDGDTLQENALKKAVELHRLTKGIVIADDTGLFVDVLNGKPGVYSARYAGEHATYADNNKLLLNQLKDVPKEKRTAHFKSVIALVFEDGSNLTVEGICKGHIDFQERGERGFGYDPLFVVQGTDKTFSEMTEEEKNKISHRAIALKNLKLKLEEVSENFSIE